MVCPDCGSVETVKDSSDIFCKKCGLELDEAVYNTKGKGSRRDAEKISLPPTLYFMIDTKIELFALKLGLKHNKLSKDWSQNVGFKLSSNWLKKEQKDKALELLDNAFEKKGSELKESRQRIEANWHKISAFYFNEMENALGLEWPTKDYQCYLSLVCNGGFHNSSKNFIVIRSRLDKLANYVIAHELFHIYFRNYINRFFKEKYDEFDDLISEVIVNFVLLTEPRLKELFPSLKFSLDFYAKEEHRKIAQKLWPIWDNKDSFKDFMMKSYAILGREKLWISY
ncbi:MAG: hypothetical protein KKF44_07800 [Nanoarchaeota archaeon]|nr:hypothetical protein [Nanoarchaeota archaeon]